MGYWERPGASDDWWTPASVFTALGNPRFDMDVAGPRGTHVPADMFWNEGGLDEAWFGFVWMNPPFGGRNALADWLRAFFDHGNGVALTPDRTSAPWFQESWGRADGVLFTRKIRFERPDGSVGVSPSNGTALWAAGARGLRALMHARSVGFGVLAIPA